MNSEEQILELLQRLVLHHCPPTVSRQQFILNNFPPSAEREILMTKYQEPGTSTAAAAAPEVEVESGRRAGTGKVLEAEQPPVEDAGAVDTGDEHDPNEGLPPIEHVKEMEARKNAHNLANHGPQLPTPRAVKTRGRSWEKKGKAGCSSSGAMKEENQQASSSKAGTSKKCPMAGGSNNKLEILKEKAAASTGFRPLNLNRENEVHLKNKTVQSTPGTAQAKALFVPPRPRSPKQEFSRVFNRILSKPELNNIPPVASAVYRAEVQDPREENDDDGSDSDMDDMPALEPIYGRSVSVPVRVAAPSRHNALFEHSRAMATIEDGKEDINMMRVDNIPRHVPKEQMMTVLKQWGDCEFREEGVTTNGRWLKVAYDSEEGLEQALEKGNELVISGSMLSCSYC